jgi:hypothetical protein
MNNSAMPFEGKQQAGMVPTRPGNSDAMKHRRPPPQQSLSLLHEKQRISPIHSDSSRQSQRPNLSDGTDSPSSLRPGKESSGESSNAEKWFDKSNNEVHEHSTSFADDEPPFFMPQSSSSETPPEVAAASTQHFASHTGDAGSLSRRANQLRIDAGAVDKQEYTDLIDDLTIQLKRLRRRLKRAEQYRISPLKHEKLFEVRTTGLHGAQKRELEHILKQFAERVDSESTPAFSHWDASKAPISDSAYKSNSLSGQLPGQMIGQLPGQVVGQLSGQVVGPSSQLAARQEKVATKRNIKNYLRNIPESQPHRKDPASMSDREKKELIVDKLEEIFLGRIASGGRHLHPLQQQEVSDLAGQEDRDAAYGYGLPHRSEGPREAHMLPRGPTSAALHSRDRPVAAAPHDSNGGDSSSAQERALPEQRPTKPLDLDPQRAQNPMDNVRYISHLGFSPIDLSSRTPQDEEHGWVYLNVLTNMAQLHSLSVTADFMRKALLEYRSKFEMSPCGAKVRWVGSNSTSRSGAESSSTQGGLDTPNHRSPRKRPRRAGAHSAQGTLRSQTHKYEYTPLLVHRNSSDSIESSLVSDDADSVFSDLPALQNDSSAMTSSGMATGLHGPSQVVFQKKRKAHDDGPIIFYKTSQFITDLSGEHNPLAHPTAAPPYNPASGVPVGLPHNLHTPVSEKRGPLATTTELPEPMDLADNPIPATEELSFPVQSSSASETDHVKPVDLEVTGIGGVWPADNFAIAVRSCHVQIENTTKQEQTLLKNPPLKFAELLAERTKGARTMLRQHRVLSSRRKDLPPSELPPALNFMSPDDHASDEDESAGEDELDELNWDQPASDGFGPSAALQPLHPPYGSSDDEEDEEDDIGDEDQDSNIDMLATLRVMDPEAVRLMELEHDASTAERLAEEIPAGSSAATAGGGSGKNSPMLASPSQKSNNLSGARLIARQAAARLKPQPSSDTASS